MILYQCPHLHLTTYDPKFCEKRKAIGRRPRPGMPQGVVDCIWPCLNCKSGLVPIARREMKLPAPQACGLPFYREVVA